MLLISKLKQYLSGPRVSLKETAPEAAYDLWSAAYDSQPGNLMLDLDEQLFAGLLQYTNLHSKIIADIGCGTGRHWKKLLQAHPARLLGFDVSEGMLNRLREKITGAEAFHLINNLLAELEDRSCDVLVSTLTMAHIENLAEALAEWNRVLKPGGTVIITDYHPDALAKGADRTFRHNGRLVAVQNYVHPLSRVNTLAAELGWELHRFEEKRIDDSVKEYYKKNNAMAVFQRFLGVPILYGVQFKKADASA